MIFKSIKLSLLSLFRELFVHHHRSLEFRAKLFAAIISAHQDENEESYGILKNIATQIYQNDEGRAEILLRTTKEYVKKVITNNGLNLDELIFDINNIIKKNQRYVSKINIDHLKQLQSQDNEEVALLQQRIIEFAQFEIHQKDLRSRKKIKKTKD